MIKDNEEEKRKVKNTLYSHRLSSFIALMMIYLYIIKYAIEYSENLSEIPIVQMFLITLIIYFISPFSSYIIILITLRILFIEREKLSPNMQKYTDLLAVFLILTFLFQLRILVTIKWNSNYKLPYTGYHAYKILTK